MITSSFLERAKIPLVAETDRQALEIALRCSWIPESRQPRVIRMRNTLRLAELDVSRSVLDLMRVEEPVEIMGDFRSPLDSAGMLIPFDR